MKLWRSMAWVGDAKRLLREASIRRFDDQYVLTVGRQLTEAECAALKELWERDYAGLSITQAIDKLQSEKCE